MTTGYFVDCKPQPIYRCLYCKYDSFQESNVKVHVARKHEFAPKPVRFEPHPMTNWRVTLGLLTWNNRETSMDTALSVVREADILKKCGCYTQIAWVDNGSTDGTRTNIRNVLNDNSTPYKAKLFDQNEGQSVARNRLIDFALAFQADWMLMLDGDIVAIPYSVAAMLSYTIDQKHRKIGCIGLNPENCTRSVSDLDVCQQALTITNDFVFPCTNLAWTQYGLFNCDVFRSGIRFDEDPVFLGPGWGFEDNDLGIQITRAGYDMPFTSLMRYFHIRSTGLNNLDKTLAAKVFNARKKYIQGKWANTRMEGLKSPV